VLGALAYLVLIPAAFDLGSFWVDIPSFTFYVVLDAYLVVRLLDAISQSADRRWRTVYGWLLLTCVAWLILDTTEALSWAEVLPWIEAGTPLDLPWMIPLVTLVLAGRPPVPRAKEDGTSAADGQLRSGRDESYEAGRKPPRSKRPGSSELSRDAPSRW